MKKEFKWMALGLMGAVMLSVTACGGKDSTKSSQADTTAAISESVSEPETAVESAEDTEFGMGTSDASVYVNTMFDIKLDAAANGMTLIDEQSRAEMAGLAGEMTDNEEVQKLIDSGKAYMDMIAYGEDQISNVNVVVQNMGVVFGIVGDADTIIDAALPNMQKQMEAAGMTGVKIEKADGSFKGESVPCIDIVSSAGDYTLYQRQVYIKSGNYLAIVTASGTDEGQTQKLLDLFTSAK